MGKWPAPIPCSSWLDPQSKVRFRFRNIHDGCFLSSCFLKGLKMTLGFLETKVADRALGKAGEGIAIANILPPVARVGQLIGRCK